MNPTTPEQEAALLKENEELKAQLAAKDFVDPNSAKLEALGFTREQVKKIRTNQQRFEEAKAIHGSGSYSERRAALAAKPA